MNAAFLVFRPAKVQAAVSLAVTQKGTADLVRLFALDWLPTRRRLVCHWHRDPDGRLSAVWEQDVAASAAARTPVSAGAAAE